MLILALLICDSVLAFVVLRGLRTPPASPPPVASAAPDSTRTPIPTAVAKSPLPPRRITRTPRPRPSPIPTRTRSPLITPAPDQGRCQETVGRVMDVMYKSRISGAEENYIVYLPPCYSTSHSRYPTIYLIHGAYHDDAHWEELGLFEAMDAGLRSGQLAPAIIVLPSGDDQLFLSTSGGADSYEAQIVEELVPSVDQLFHTDTRPEMRAIGGISRGGVWSLEIGFVHPELFGIVGGHSACLNLNESPPEFDPLKLTDNPALKTQRIWLDASDGDDCLPGTDDLHTALENSGVAHRYEIWPGVHEDDYWAEHLLDYLAFYTLVWPKS